MVHKHDSLVGEKFMLRYRKNKYNEVVVEEPKEQTTTRKYGVLETVMENDEDDFLEAQAERESSPDVKFTPVVLKYQLVDHDNAKDSHSEDSESDFEDTWHEDNHEDDGLACRAAQMLRNKPEKRRVYSPTKIRMEKFKLTSIVSSSSPSSSDCHSTNSDLSESFYQDYGSVTDMENAERSLLFLEDFGESDWEDLESDESGYSLCFSSSEDTEDSEYDIFVKQLMAIDLS